MYGTPISPTVPVWLSESNHRLFCSTRTGNVMWIIKFLVIWFSLSFIASIFCDQIYFSEIFCVVPNFYILEASFHNFLMEMVNRLFCGCKYEMLYLALLLLCLYSPLLVGRFISFLIIYTVCMRLPTHTTTQNTEWTHTDIHVSSGNRIDGPSVRAGEHSYCLRPHFHCGQQLFYAWNLFKVDDAHPCVEKCNQICESVRRSP
jgi:hypothetical protein